METHPISARTVVGERSLALAAMLGGFAVVASALRGAWGFPLDDSYIHQTVARNFARYHVPGLVPGQRSSGSTSVLWSYIQASRFWLGNHVDPVLFNLLLSVLLLAVLSQLLYSLVQNDKLPRQARMLVVVGAGVCGNFLWLGLLGMEHLLFVVFSVAAVLTWCNSEAQHSQRSAIWTGVFAGLVALTRPEGVILIAVLVLAAPRLGRSRRQAAVAFAAWLPFLAILLGSDWYTSHSLLPATLAGRTWLDFHEHGGPHSLWALRNLSGSWFLRLPRMINANLTLPGNVKIAAAKGLVEWVLAAAGLAWLFQVRSRRLLLLCAWCAAHMATFLATFPNSGSGGRYQPLLLMLALPLMFLGIWQLLGWAAKKLGWPLEPAVWAAVLMVGAWSLGTWRMVALDGIDHINATHGQIAQWINRNLPPEASIGSFDIGRISYDRQGRAVVDLGGLADSAYMPYLVAGDISPYLAKEHIQYVVLPSSMGTVLGLWPGHGVGPALAGYCSPQESWLLGYSATHHAAQCQSIYKVQ